MSLIQEKLEQAAPLVAEADCDVWLTFVRETSGHADPALPFLTEVGLTWESALLVSRDGRRIAVVGNYDADPLIAARHWDQVIPYVQSIQDPLRAALEILIPRSQAQPRIAVNWSENNDKADGLTHGMFRRLQSILAGTRFEGCLVSAEPIVGALRGRKTAAERERILQAIAETDRLFEEVANEFARVGVTEQQIWAQIQRRIDKRGLGYAWERAGNPIVNCGPASMHGHGTPSPTLSLADGHRPTPDRFSRSSVLRTNTGCGIGIPTEWRTDWADPLRAGGCCCDDWGRVAAPTQRAIAYTDGAGCGRAFPPDRFRQSCPSTSPPPGGRYAESTTGRDRRKHNPSHVRAAVASEGSPPGLAPRYPVPIPVRRARAIPMR